MRDPSRIYVVGVVPGDTGAAKHAGYTVCRNRLVCDLEKKAQAEGEHFHPTTVAESAAWAAAAERARQAPYITISGATGPYAGRVNGMFKLMAAKKVSGAPVWRRADGMRYLYLSTAGQRWMVGDAESMAASKDAGFAQSKPVEAGTLPTEAHTWDVFHGPGKWQAQQLQVRLFHPPFECDAVAC